ncbi:MAG TPA: hypothetical protein VFB25_09895 [Gaiellaceae bacterium]|nr:hypothetical protein [Gaiellaceae bacterium]
MTAPLDPDAQLRALEGREWRSAAEALAAVAEATASINAHVAGVAQDRAVPDRLEHWIERLSAIAADVARTFDAFTYSVGVSIPGGVSVSISWQAN